MDAAREGTRRRLLAGLHVDARREGEDHAFAGVAASLVDVQYDVSWPKMKTVRSHRVPTDRLLSPGLISQNPRSTRARCVSEAASRFSSDFAGTSGLPPAGLGAARYRAGMSASENLLLGRAWLSAFNSHDVDALVALYAEDATHTSPKIRALHPETGGQLVGRASLARWWKDANARLPNLRYDESAITASDERVILEYVRHAPDAPPMPVAEAFDVRAGKIVASRVYHG